ncbi:hypothetical protein B5F08_11765 [Anaeromassilibacillus sp. An172]|uniref:hypothetical protein n=1 Tax=Anaeromassilibacillus sp. An172 TaxID=1965570 RepID=UPI000B374965|nr:hypothetical protein [Anaeromassilibacillus sp. An172]OUP74843.1 hypothetical protein B5F08_11765 [Anaeromassilibacillus sp. An172]
MVNEQKILEIIEKRRKAHPQDPQKEKLFWFPLRDALGDNEQDALFYLNNIDDDKAVFFSEIYEDVIERFPSNEMENIFKDIIDRAREYMITNDVFE